MGGTEIERWRLEERDAVLRHATAIASQAAKANRQGKEAADAAAEFVAFVLRQAFAARDEELRLAGRHPSSL